MLYSVHIWRYLRLLRANEKASTDISTVSELSPFSYQNRRVIFLAWLQQHSHCLFRSTFVFFLIQNNLFGMIFVFYHVVLPIQFECIHVGFLFHLFFFQQSLMRIQFLPFVSAHLVTICGGIRIPSINSTAVYRCIDKRERKAKSHTSIACISLSMMFYSRLN